MRFKGLDLNLLIAFDALVTTRSIARAAERLHLSEPAVSAALGRLRDFFRDALLVRDGKGFGTTAAALALLPLVRQCLRDADALVAARAGFAPGGGARTFRIVASDYSATTLLTRVAATLAEVAPNVVLEIVPPIDGKASPLLTGGVDLVICPEPFSALDHPSEPLYLDHYVFAGWRDNPVFAAPLTVRDISAAGHVALRFGPGGEPSYGDQQLEALGIARRIEIWCGSFAAAPWFLIGTTRLMLMYARMARHVAGTMPIRYAPPPFAMPPVPILLQYHRARREDAGLSWLRGRIHAAVAEA